VTLIRGFWQILISYCKFLMPRSLKWSILGAHIIILSKNIHKVTKTDYVWFEFLWIRRYYFSIFSPRKNEIRKSNYVTNRTDQIPTADLPVRWCKRIFDISFDDRCFSSWGAPNKQDFTNLYFRSQHSLVKKMNVYIK
jgi:hypothetical protein